MGKQQRRSRESASTEATPRVAPPSGSGAGNQFFMGLVEAGYAPILPSLAARAFVPRGDLQVRVVDVRDEMGQAAEHAWGADVVEFTGISDMVAGVIEHADGRPIDLLTITDHGAPGHQEIGDSWLHPGSFDAFEPVLARLTPHFAPGARVDLEGCQVAASEEGQDLVERLAQLWGVEVVAGANLQRPVIPGFEGDSWACRADEPDGPTACRRIVPWTDPFWDWLDARMLPGRPYDVPER